MFKATLYYGSEAQVFKEGTPKDWKHHRWALVGITRLDQQNWRKK
jgi:hypothetical protein